MNRKEFEHVVRAAAEIVDDEIVVIGSQAVHGQFHSLPGELLVSRELDVYPLNAPERAGEIDAAIGDGSRFDSTFGYYAHGVGPESAKAPAGWQDRLVRVEFPARNRQRAVVGWCMEIHDLVLAKLAAGRSHDVEFVRVAIRAGLVDRTKLQVALDSMPEGTRELTAERLAAVLAQLDRNG